MDTYQHTSCGKRSLSNSECERGLCIAPDLKSIFRGRLQHRCEQSSQFTLTAQCLTFHEVLENLLQHSHKLALYFWTDKHPNRPIFVVSATQQLPALHGISSTGLLQWWLTTLCQSTQMEIKIQLLIWQDWGTKCPQSLPKNQKYTLYSINSFFSPRYAYIPPSAIQPQEEEPGWGLAVV